VKIAWRTRVMHVGSEYSDEHSEDILNATRGFMQHLANRLSDDDQISPDVPPVQ
jgi:hypothetical protein